MLKILIAFSLLLFIAILLWLVRKIDKTSTPKTDKHDEIKETFQRLAEEIAEKRTKIPIFSSETITHQEAEFADESLFALLPKWAKWLAFLLILLFIIIVFYYIQSSA